MFLSPCALIVGSHVNVCSESSDKDDGLCKTTIELKTKNENKNQEKKTDIKYAIHGSCPSLLHNLYVHPWCNYPACMSRVSTLSASPFSSAGVGTVTEIP